MDMKLTTLNVYATPRYWGDTKVDEMYDTEDGNNIPCRNHDRWEPIIDIETGRITNWEQGKTANIHYKVADECGWALFLENGERFMWVEDGYVPATLSPKGDGFGDYIIMDVDENGMIAGWKFDLGDFTNHENGNDANRLLCAVYIVLDCEAPPKDVIWSVNSTMEKAIESEKQLNEMRVGGALTKIIEERVD